MHQILFQSITRPYISLISTYILSRSRSKHAEQALHASLGVYFKTLCQVVCFPRSDYIPTKTLCVLRSIHLGQRCAWVSGPKKTTLHRALRAVQWANTNFIGSRCARFSDEKNTLHRASFFNMWSRFVILFRYLLQISTSNHHILCYLITISILHQSPLTYFAAPDRSTQRKLCMLRSGLISKHCAK